MSIPPKKEFERVVIDEEIRGEIVKIEEDMEHTFIWQGKESKQPGIRFWFKLDGYKDEHPSRWMKFLYTEKANLYKKYLKPLVAGMKPNLNWDIQGLTGFKVKTYWNQEEVNGNVYQHIETIIPDGKKLVPVVLDDKGVVADTNSAPAQEEDSVPF